jgi:hypothetical protein
MKFRNSNDKKLAGKDAARRVSRADTLNLPRVFLFLEVFVEKEVSGRSTK